MADTTLTGAEKEVTVNTDAAINAEERKKKLIKYALIAIAAVGIFFLFKKFVLKK